MVDPDDLSGGGDAENEQPALDVAVGECRDGLDDEFLDSIEGASGDGCAPDRTARLLAVEVLTLELVVFRVSQEAPRRLRIVKHSAWRWS